MRALSEDRADARFALYVEGLDQSYPDDLLEILANRATRGAQMLDRIEPGWQNKINLREFSISSTRRCVVAQVFGVHDDDSAWLAFQEIDDDLSRATSDKLSDRTGVSADFGLVDWMEVPVQLDALNAAWRQLILARRVIETAAATA